MLVAGCSACRNMVPLMCAGGFPPHPPFPVEMTPFGPGCRFCGPLQPVFTCTICGTFQALYLPGMAPPAPAFGAPQLTAPVVQASQSAPKSEWRVLIETAVKEVAGSAGKQFGHDMGVWAQ
jgi:hypothetical protein